MEPISQFNQSPEVVMFLDHANSREVSRAKAKGARVGLLVTAPGMEARGDLPDFDFVSVYRPGFRADMLKRSLAEFERRLLSVVIIANGRGLDSSVAAITGATPSDEEATG